MSNGEPTLTRATIFFHIFGNDKDGDTRVIVQIRQTDSTLAAIVDDTFGRFEDDPQATMGRLIWRLWVIAPKAHLPQEAVLCGSTPMETIVGSSMVNSLWTSLRVM